VSVIEVISILGTLGVAIGLIATWLRSGKSQARRDGLLEERIAGIQKLLDNEHTGLGAIKKSVEDQKVHCATMTSSFAERIKTLEDG